MKVCMKSARSWTTNPPTVQLFTTCLFLMERLQIKMSFHCFSCMLVEDHRACRDTLTSGILNAQIVAKHTWLPKRLAKY